LGERRFAAANKNSKKKAKTTTTAAAAAARCRIMRPATITCSSASGASNPLDFVNFVIRGLAGLGVWSDEDACPIPRRFNLVAVDEVAQMTVALHLAADMEESDAVSISHITAHGDDNLTRLSALAQMLQVEGFPMVEVSAAEFKERLASLPPDNPLFVFQSILMQDNQGRRLDCNAPHDTNNLRLLQRLPDTSPYRHLAQGCSPVDQGLVKLLLNFFQKEQLLQEPAKASTADS